MMLRPRPGIMDIAPYRGGDSRLAAAPDGKTLLMDVEMAEQERAVYEWVKANQPHLYLDWQPFQHPQLGAIEIGGWDELHLWSNAPENMLLAEVKPHAEFAVYQALCSPRLEVLKASATSIGEGAWRVEVGVANTGWLPTYISQHARAKKLVLPTVASLSGAEVVDGITAKMIRRHPHVFGDAAARTAGGEIDVCDDVMLAVALNDALAQPAGRAPGASAGEIDVGDDVMLAIARHWGIPARYVSGYLFTRGDAGHRSSADATHAWIEAFGSSI